MFKRFWGDAALNSKEKVNVKTIERKKKSSSEVASLKRATIGCGAQANIQGGVIPRPQERGKPKKRGKPINMSIPAPMKPR